MLLSVKFIIAANENESVLSHLIEIFVYTSLNFDTLWRVGM